MVPRVSSVKEFKQKIHELRDRLDFDNGTAQKNKTLLLTLKDLCQSTLEETNDQNLKEFIFQELNRIEKDMTKIKGISHDLKSGISGRSSTSFDNIFIPKRPTKEALTSIQVGGFDPSSSPILRKLSQKSVFASKSLKNKTYKKVQQSTENKSNPAMIQPKNNDYEEEIQTISEKNVQDIKQTDDLTSNQSINQTKSQTKTQSTEDIFEQTEEQIKKLQSSLSEIASEPFPDSLNEKEISKSKETQKMPSESPYKSAKLIISQLGLEIQLNFDQTTYRIGRDLFATIEIPIELPDNFFEPIIPLSNESEKPSEHCVIEQSKRGVFRIKDQANLQKTYMNNQFLTSEGLNLHDGDTFIFPVLINDQLASLSIEFRILD
ncbi:FHA domain-containing protein [Candidatus Harpocratesius sp.]